MPGRRHEGFLERFGVVAVLDLVRRLQAEEPAAVEDADAVGENLRFAQVVRAEQDRRVVRSPDLADEVLNLELRPWIEAGRRLVQEEQDG